MRRVLIPCSRPSLTSLVAFFLIVTPVVYVLSYAPVVHVCGRTVETRIDTAELDIPFPQGSIALHFPRELVLQDRLADASLYPMYAPVDWLIDRTSFRDPLFWWADLWGVRSDFESGKMQRFCRGDSTGR